jgi:hypothetical protein
MPRLANISKYWTERTSGASGSSNDRFIDAPSIGFCWMPLTKFGSGMPAAARIVGATSITWENWSRISPLDSMPFGQCTTVALRVPPQWEATCLVHWNGVFMACAQPTA